MGRFIGYSVRCWWEGPSREQPIHLVREVLASLGRATSKAKRIYTTNHWTEEVTLHPRNPPVGVAPDGSWAR
jgi:hypothetical protein